MISLMRGFLKSFDGFEPVDFDTYTPDKWSSNLHNLPRMKVKQKLESLADRIKDALVGAGLEIGYEVSSERPSIWNQKRVDAQWLYFERDAAARKDLQSIIDRNRSLADNIEDPAHHHRHTVIAVRVDAEGVSVLCGVHHSAWLDRHNLQKRVEDEHERARLLVALGELPRDGLELLVDEARTGFVELDDEALLATLEGAAEVPGWIALERRWAADDAAVASEDFADTLVDACTTLAPAYQQLTWSRDNDHVSVAKTVAEEKKARRRSGSGHFEENDPVEIVGGLFAGRKGVVSGYDRAGKVKVKVGTLTLPVNAGALKLIR